MPEFFVGENFCAMFQKVSVSEKLYALERGGIKLSRRNFLVSLCRKLSQGNPSVLYVGKIPVTKKIMDERGVWGYQDFPSEAFLSHCAKFFAVEPFCVVFQKTSASERD